MMKENGRSPSDEGSGCQPSASAAEGASSQSGIPNAEQLSMLRQLSKAEPRTVMNASLRRALEHKGLIRSQPYGTSKGYVSYLTDTGAALVPGTSEFELIRRIAKAAFSTGAVAHIAGDDPKEAWESFSRCIPELALSNASAIEARQRQDAVERLGPKGESATLEEGDAQGGPA